MMLGVYRSGEDLQHDDDVAGGSGAGNFFLDKRLQELAASVTSQMEEADEREPVSGAGASTTESAFEISEIAVGNLNLADVNKVRNLRAAKKSVGFSAFESAGSYALKGIESLPPTTRWTDCGDVTLDLYSTAAEAET
jgi:hypothetical protein